MNRFSRCIDRLLIIALLEKHTRQLALVQTPQTPSEVRVADAHAHQFVRYRMQHVEVRVCLFVQEKQYVGRIQVRGCVLLGERMELLDHIGIASGAGL